METSVYQSDLALHPGEFLEEVLQDAGMTQTELSHRIGRPIQMINEIIKGKKSITPATAIELEDVLKVPAHIWIGLESEYQMVKAKQEEIKSLEAEKEAAKRFPYARLLELGLVKPANNPIERVSELRGFMGVARLAQLPQVQAYRAAFRMGNGTGDISHEAVAAWLQAGRVFAEKMKIKPFDKKHLESALLLLRSLTMDSGKDVLEKSKEILAGCGVAFVLLNHFPKTRTNGATFWLKGGEKAVILMSLRGAYTDIFWFSLFHEIAHILLHGKRELFLEDGYNDPTLRQQEDEADAFASDVLIPAGKYKAFVASGLFGKEAIISFAKKAGIAPGVVVGRLMHDKFVSFKDYTLDSLREKHA